MELMYIPDMEESEAERFIFDSTDVLGLPLDKPVLDGVGDNEIVLHEGDRKIIL